MNGAKVRAGDWLAEKTAGAMPSGAVLLHAPSFAFQAPGGGETQLIQTGQHLEKRGVAVRPFVPWVDRLEDARVLHLFGMSREGLELAKIAKSRRVPVVLSPICWFEPRFLSVAGRAKWAVHRAFPGIPGWRRHLLSLSDAILPNSRAEGRQLVSGFGVNPSKIRPVPNGVDERFATADPSLFRASCPEIGDFVLFVGRIEPRKNPLGWIRAAKIAGLPCVAVGDIVPGHERYGRICRQEGGSLVTWFARRDHADPWLASAYAASRVFALPSWFETPGLAALEAALAGTAVVITPHGCTREYFGERAHYARPDHPREIALAMQTAWERGADRELCDHVRSNYLWSHAARATMEAYDEVAG